MAGQMQPAGCTALNANGRVYVIEFLPDEMVAWTVRVTLEEPTSELLSIEMQMHSVGTIQQFCGTSRCHECREPICQWSGRRRLFFLPESQNRIGT